MDNKNRSFSMIADVEGDYSDLTNMEMPDVLPILAVRNLVAHSQSGKKRNHRRSNMSKRS